MNKPTQRDTDVPAPDRAVEIADRPRDQFRAADIALVEIAKLQNDGEHIKSFLSDIKGDLRDVRDRTIKLEEIIRASDKILEETRKKVVRIHTWVVGASAIAAFLVIASQIVPRFWPGK